MCMAGTPPFSGYKTCRNCALPNPIMSNFCSRCGASLPDGVLDLHPHYPAAPMITPPPRSRAGFLVVGLVVLVAFVVVIGIFSSLPTPHPTTPQAETNDSPAQASDTSRPPPISPPPAPGSQWDYSTDEDNMGRKRSFAVVTSTNALDFGFPYSGIQYGRLTIRKGAGHGNEVIVSIEKGQFLCGIEDCTVNIRFDDGQIQRFTAVPPSDQSTTVLFIEEASSFVARLRRAKTVRIEATFYQEGAQSLDFNVDGFRW